MFLNQVLGSIVIQILKGQINYVVKLKYYLTKCYHLKTIKKFQVLLTGIEKIGSNLVIFKEFIGKWPVVIHTGIVVGAICQNAILGVKTSAGWQVSRMTMTQVPP